MRNYFIILCICLLFGNDEGIEISMSGIKKSLGVVGIGSGTSPLEKFAPKDIIISAKDTVVGMAETIPQSVPTVNTILSLNKNLVAGLPVEVAFDLINKACSASIAEKQVKPRLLPNVSEMNFMLRTCHGDHLVPLLTPQKLLTHPAFKKNLKTAIFVTGWFSNINSTMENDALETVWAAFKCRGDMNFIAVDTAAYVDSLYTWSAFNTDALGKIIAEGLVEMLKVYPKENIHLIGHSLGAHIVGAIGRYYNMLTSTMLPRITALDAASPCFNEGENLNSLSRGDAEFVDAIHSNSGVLGKKEPIGDVDFYPNGVNPLPPGCMTIVCAHGRSWEFFAESVRPGNQNAFMATRCNSITALNSSKCPGKRIPMGFACPTNAKGNYFLNTSSRKPYGQETLKESEITCSKCE